MEANKKGMSPVTAGVTGVVIGAAATAVGIALSNKETRKKVSAKAGQLAHASKDYARQLKDTSGSTIKQINGKLTQGQSAPQHGAKGGSKAAQKSEK